MLETTQLTNFTIKDLVDKYGQQYFVIVDNNNLDDAYFCFRKTLKEG